jgi:hypothetical protein
MANQQKRGEGGGKCSLMAKWWAGVPKEQRPFIEERAKAFPFMRPCPRNKGLWVRKEDECDRCEYAVFEAESSSDTSNIGKGNEE